MEKEFIPWPDYAVCPNCKTKVDLLKSWKIFNEPDEKKSVQCPSCGKTIDYIEPNKMGLPPYSVE